ncbi:hypothetical protein C8250_023140 [Streptomyces sp. So13.3]|uniref:hypothetical protein n=1 Tax=Streptomyces TaxID=1883 RepID=UPI00110758CB|nr:MULTISPECIES: hypothetical protein [Streptomyces]MCZ4094940.1 hypothetical protein [Streptomyces sp. H39-C1]QNA74405.1 hypothetical protein C8250_023140 [Streptomyces sp. So13.3]
MSTTRHLINRQRRLAAAPPANRTRPGPPPAPEQDKPGQKPEQKQKRDRKPAQKPSVKKPGRGRGGSVLHRVVAALGLLTVLLGGFAGWAAMEAATLHDTAATRNTALTDTARTSEVKGMVTQAVNSVFSYNYADTARTDQAAKKLLTGKAVQQYADMLAQVRKQAPVQKLVLTTTVTDSGVELIDGDRARVLIFADQRNTRTAPKEETTYAAAMFAVDAVHQDGVWKIGNIDTFNR